LSLAGPGQRVVDHLQQLLPTKGLAERRRGDLERISRVVARHHDQAASGVLASHLLHQLGAAHAGHAHVSQHQVHVMGFQLTQGLDTILRDDDFVPMKA